MNIKVLEAFVNNPGDLSWEPLNQCGNVEIYDRTSPEEVAERVHDADIVVSSKLPWTKESLDKAPRLKLIALTSTGYNIIDFAETNKRGITVCYVPAYSTPDVVQMTFALILELCLHLADHSRGVREGAWIESAHFSYWNYPLVEISNKTLGIVGMGSIGQSVARVAQAFGMNVLFSSRSPKPEYENEYCKQVSFDEVLSQSDFVSLHCPATAETHELINRDTIEKMKTGSYLINTARGTLVNEYDLAEALNTGKLAGAGVDVVAIEPMTPSNPLRTAQNIVITPHIAWATREARTRLLDTVFANVEAFCKGKPQNVVS